MQEVAPGAAPSKYLKTSACLKHFAAYSSEGQAHTASVRTGFPAVVTRQDMEDTYMVAFKAGVQKGRASSIMCRCGEVRRQVRGQCAQA